MAAVVPSGFFDKTPSTSGKYEDDDYKKWLDQAITTTDGSTASDGFAKGEQDKVNEFYNALLELKNKTNTASTKTDIEAAFNTAQDDSGQADTDVADLQKIVDGIQARLDNLSSTDTSKVKATDDQIAAVQKQLKAAQNALADAQQKQAQIKRNYSYLASLRTWTNNVKFRDSGYWDFLNQSATTTSNYDNNIPDAFNIADDRDWAALAAGAGKSTDGGFVQKDLDELNQFDDTLSKKISSFSLASSQGDIDAAYQDAVNKSQQADTDVNEIQTMLDGLTARRNNTATASSRTAADNADLDAKIKYTQQALAAAKTKQKNISGEVTTLKNLQDMLASLDSIQSALDKSLNALTNAQTAASGASQPGGTLDAAQKRDDDANKAETDATAQAKAAQDEVAKAQDALNNLPTTATAAQKAVLQNILTEAKNRNQAAQDNLAQVKKYHKQTTDALTQARADDAQKTKDQTDAYKNQIKALTDQISDTTKASSLQNVRDMLTASQIAAQQQNLSGQGTIAQAQQSLASEKMTVQQQLAELAQKSAATGYTNQLSQMTYLEAIREKAFNLLADLEKTRADNAFTRAKAAVQMAKY